MVISLGGAAGLLGAMPSPGAVEGEVRRFVANGGPLLYVNLFWLGCALIVIVERLYALLYRYNLNGPQFMEHITQLVRAGNLDRAIKACEVAPNSPLTQMLRAGLERVRAREVGSGRAFDEALLEYGPALEKRVGWLRSFAAIASIVGLLGTSAGLIGAFASVPTVAPALQKTVLAQGIAQAMMHTAFGLSIALVCVMGHFVLSVASKRAEEWVELNALRLENLLARTRAHPPRT